MIFSIFELEKTISQLAFTQSYLFTLQNQYICSTVSFPDLRAINLTEMSNNITITPP